MTPGAFYLQIYLSIVLHTFHIDCMQVIYWLCSTLGLGQIRKLMKTCWLISTSSHYYLSGYNNDFHHWNINTFSVMGSKWQHKAILHSFFWWIMGWVWQHKAILHSLYCGITGSMFPDKSTFFIFLDYTRQQKWQECMVWRKWACICTELKQGPHKMYI